MKLFTKQMLGILSAATVGLVAVLIVGQSGFIAPTSSNLSTYAITINNETTNDWDFLSTNGYANKTEQFRYTNFSFDDSMLNNTSGTKTLQLKSSTGKVYNETAINGLISLSVSYVSDTNLIASFGDEINPSTSSFDIVSGQTYYLSEYAQNTYLSIKTGSSDAKISEIKITYSCIPVEQTTITSLNITSLPHKTTYVVGDTLDTTGLVITANYSNGSSKVVTSECVLNPKNGDILNTVGTQTVTCTYTPTGITESFEITVVGETQTLTKQDVRYDYHDLKQNGIYNTPAMPSTGNSKMLVVPIWFADSSNYINSVDKASIRSDIEEAYFGEANTSSLPWHSVKSYYETESKGALNLSGKVTDWYETSYSSTTITSDQVDLLVENVGNSLKQQLGSEYNSYDTDKDGYIDALILIYAVPYNTTDDDSPLWAYCFWLQLENYNINNPIANTYFWASYKFMYESGRDHIDAHTYIHEMGHVLGLDDYYDYAYQDGNNPAAGFSMQDHNVGSHDPFSQMALGWVEPYVPTDDITIEIESFQESGDVILLSPEWTGSPFDEYLLLELYTPTGLNAYDVNNSGTYISGADDIGIRLWHVDARLRRCYESGGYLYFYTNSYYTNFDAGDYYQIGPSNTTYVNNNYVDTKGYAAFVEEDRNYDLLALIRNSRANDDEMQDNLNSLMLFKAGDSFTMSSYSSQFPKGSVLNSGSSLGFSFEVLSIDKVNLTATIQIQKL